MEGLGRGAGQVSRVCDVRVFEILVSLRCRRRGLARQFSCLLYDKASALQFTRNMKRIERISIGSTSLVTAIVGPSKNQQSKPDPKP